MTAVLRLVEIMAALRTPVTGCPWDLEQSFETIAPYTIEEAYEVADAIARGDLVDLKDELGDLLLQVVFHARMAQEGGVFDLADVADAICDKMVRRHPHVFADGGANTPEAVKSTWEDIKAAETAARASRRTSAGLPPDDGGTGPLAGVAAALPALSRAEKLQKRAARTGFDWPSADGIFDKIAEETEEVRAAATGDDPSALEEEIGDLLFSVVNLARFRGIDPETALRQANRKFENRFNAMTERLSGTGRSLSDATLDEMDAAWDAAKRIENGECD